MTNYVMMIIVFVMGISAGQVLVFEEIQKQCDKKNYINLNGELYYGCYPLLRKE